MISPISQSINSAYGLNNLQKALQADRPAAKTPITLGGPGSVGGTTALTGSTGAAPAGKSTSFADMVGQLIHDVDHKGKVAQADAQKLMLGESGNIHQSMIAMQESSVAFTMLVEVRNKLVSSYQELMRMPV